MTLILSIHFALTAASLKLFCLKKLPSLCYILCTEWRGLSLTQCVVYGNPSIVSYFAFISNKSVAPGNFSFNCAARGQRTGLSWSLLRSKWNVIGLKRKLSFFCYVLYILSERGTWALSSRWTMLSNTNIKHDRVKNVGNLLSKKNEKF